MAGVVQDGSWKGDKADPTSTSPPPALYGYGILFQVSYGIYTEYITIYTVRRNSTVGGEARTSPGDSVPGNVLLVRMTLYSRRMARRPLREWREVPPGLRDQTPRIRPVLLMPDPYCRILSTVHVVMYRYATTLYMIVDYCTGTIGMGIFIDRQLLLHHQPCM